MKTHRTRHQGFTLIELMVGSALGLLAILIITQALSASTIQNRQIAGSNDAQQAGTIVNYQIRSILRQAGSNLSHSSNAWGCGLRAARGSETLLPGASWPAPFSALPGNLRAAPIAVLGASSGSHASDVLLVLGGSGSTAKVFSATLNTSDNEFIVENSNGVLPSDYLLMVSDTAIGADCYLFRTNSHFTVVNENGKLEDTPKAIPFDTGFMASHNLTAMPENALLFNLGSAPKFFMFSVDPNKRALVLYDLMQNRNAGTAGSAVTLGENVFLLRVLYGVESGSGGLIWQSPTASGWTFSDLQAGTQIANGHLSQIKALRIALVMRATYPSSDLSPASIHLFSSLADSLQQTIVLTSEERRYRYQIYETVVPLYNL
jgi:type IV pilus assembly protein PilW